MTYRIHRFWQYHKRKMLFLSIALLSALVLCKWRDFYRLIFEPGISGAIDLKKFHRLVHAWFSVPDVLIIHKDAVYPPATYVLLWPLLGWLELEPARLLWAVISLVFVGWMVVLIIRESAANTSLEKIIFVLIYIGMNPVGVTIGNGQLIILILPVLLTSLIIIRDCPGRWSSLVAILLFIWALIKPNVSAPFLWIILFAPKKRFLIFLSILLGYALITLYAASVQLPHFLSNIYSGDLFTFFQQSIQRMTLIKITALDSGTAIAGYANIQNWLVVLELDQWNMPVLISSLFLFGFWVFRNHRADFWTLVGFTALVTRFLTYHRVYDNTLLIFAMIALYRIIKTMVSDEARQEIAGVLFILMVGTLITPTAFLSLPGLMGILIRGIHSVIWLDTLIFLGWCAHREAKLEVANRFL